MFDTLAWQHEWYVVKRETRCVGGLGGGVFVWRPSARVMNAQMVFESRNAAIRAAL